MNCGKNFIRFAPSFVSMALISILAWFCFSTFAAGVNQNVQISSQVAFGLQSAYPEILLQYQEPSTTTAQFSGATTITIPANTTDNTINTATLFSGITTPIVMGFVDVTNPGVSIGIGTAADDTRIEMAAGGFIIYRTASGMPTFYADNATDNDANIRVFVMGE